MHSFIISKIEAKKRYWLFLFSHIYKNKGSVFPENKLWPRFLDIANYFPWCIAAGSFLITGIVPIKAVL